MPFAIIVDALLEIVRVLLALPFWCAVLEIASASFAVRQLDYIIPLPVGIRNPIHHVAAAGDQTVIVAFDAGSGNQRGFYRDIAPGTGEPLRFHVSGNPWFIEPGSETLVVAGNDWWYATQDSQDGAPAVTFVKSDGARSTFAKPPALRGDDPSRSWPMAAIAGEKPRVMLFNYGHEETIAAEMNATGATRSWRLPPSNSAHVLNTIAEPLPDGRIALIVNDSSLYLYLLADEGKVEAIPLRNIHLTAFAAAMDAAGRIAIVTARKDNAAVEAAIIDPAHAERAEWRPLPHDTHVAGYRLHIVATAGGFAAAWVNDGPKRLIEAADIDRNGHWGPVVEVGRPYSRAETFLDLQARNDELLFWWDDGQHLFERRLPAWLKGYAALTALRCADPKQTGDPLRDDGLMRLFRYLRNLGALN